MFDIHCHILHGVDDGSGNLSDSLEMAKLAADSGTKAIIATPHCNIPATFDNYWSKDIETKFSALRQAVRECGIPVEIYKGQEIFLSKKFIGTSKKETRTNIDSIIGERCIVTEKIDNIHGTGKVRLNGMDWSARSADSDTLYEVDDIVYVDRVEGVKLIVKNNIN